MIFEVGNDRYKVFLFEWRDFFQNLFNAFRKPEFHLHWNGSEKLETKFGTYAVRRGTQDVTVVSPAFERLDMNRMLMTVDQMAAEGRFLFVDIGSNIGRYAVAVAKRMSAQADVHVFEPDPTNLELLRQNLSFVEAHVHAVGLSESPGQANLLVNKNRPWDQEIGEIGRSIILDTLDQCLGNYALDRVVIKMDVDGHELSVLKGGRKTFSRIGHAVLLIEDVIQRDVLYKALTDIGFRPVCKLTPYNSWWELGPR